MKYVRHKTKGFFVFPDSDRVWHMHIGRWLGEEDIVSAGFVYADKTGKLVCYGYSQSLEIGSLEEDSELINKEIGLHWDG